MPMDCSRGYIEVSGMIPDSNSRKADWKGCLLVTSLSMAFYIYTIAPDVLWNDSPIFQLRIYLGDYIGVLGLALSHPLYIFTGRLFTFLPFHNLAYKANLISAVFGALTVGNLFLLLRWWRINRLGAALASLTLLVSHTFWTNSVIAEVYTLYSFLFLVELILVTQFLETRQKKYLFWLFLVNGLNISNHLLASLNLLIYFSYTIILLHKREITGRDFILLCFLTLLGALPYEIFIAEEYFHTRSFLLTLRSALVGSNVWQKDVLNTKVFCWRNFKNLILFLGMNFPVFHIYFVVPGAKMFWKERDWQAHFLFTGIFLISFIFAFRYTVADQYVFYFPVYIFVALLIGLGVDKVSRMSSKGNRWMLAILFFSSISPIFIYQKAPIFAEKYKINIGVTRQIPYRNSYQYFLNPSKRNYHGARKYMLDITRLAERNSVIIPDYTIINTLLYFQKAEGIGSDLLIAGLPNVQGDFPNCIEVTPANIFDLLKDHRVYLTSDLPQYNPPWILENFRIQKRGILYQVLIPD
ncbi:MAG: protein O-mannosyl-transferase family [bacterium]